MAAFRYGMVDIEWLGHASFRISTQGKIIYVDPYVLDEEPLPADIIIVTHEHYDHCAVDNIQKLMKESTLVLAPQNCLTKLAFVPRKSLQLIAPDDTLVVGDLRIHTIPAYNDNKFRAHNIPYHSKGFGFGFVMTFAGVKIYHAGDTDFVPEMRELALENIDVALVPVGGKYTMDAREAAQAIKAIHPKVAIPMHWGSDVVGTQEDADRFKELAEDTCEIVVL
ncbi:MBL fold metallo-hydrolase [Candidatus Woesearchaeota archaeon]|jgi:L-ascorbate metabolism protein UlaG (beta-lactamase superfamily)|nr:MBL fold metallo-hydrolase [Candidatus Woesearchaeota archaeon]MBT4114416.1 MBL fold metallo-hydrolase [Candidatus Woesearchaeota archaeon]MBT4248279.1 MBL fold metallo-hydrolase [Candidatus Woesearchaeota archaeon]